MTREQRPRGTKVSYLLSPMEGVRVEALLVEEKLPVEWQTYL